VKTTDPASKVSFTVYRDAQHEVRFYAGWTGTAATEPTVVLREDRPGSYVETITMSATPNVTAGRPSGDEAIANLESLSRSHVSAGGQVVQADE
jgi:hypothetical protein